MPVLAVLIVVFPKLAVLRPVTLHHLTLLQEGRVFSRTLLTAVRGVASDWSAAGERGTGDFLTVHFSCRALEYRHKLRLELNNIRA